MSYLTFAGEEKLMPASKFLRGLDRGAQKIIKEKNYLFD